MGGTYSHGQERTKLQFFYLFEKKLEISKKRAFSLF